MERIGLERLTGMLLIIAVIAFGTAATVLSMTFEWPDILRKDPDYVLTKFADGGDPLIFTWLAVAWTFFLLIFPIVLLGKVLDREGKSSIVPLATTIGVIAVIASVVGFLRWVLVVPDLAELYFAEGATQSARDGVIASFTAQHQYGGTLLGEHVGQMLSVVWSSLICVAILQTRKYPRWLAYFGFVAGGVYTLAQGEVLETAVDGFPVLDIAGFAGSTLWALWVLALGVTLVRQPQTEPVAEPSRLAMAEGSMA